METSTEKPGYFRAFHPNWLVFLLVVFGHFVKNCTGKSDKNEEHSQTEYTAHSFVRCEDFPLLRQNVGANNPSRFFQIWLNLPRRNKMVEPEFAMFWAHQVPKYHVTGGDEAATVTLWSGVDYFGISQPNAPPPASWAADPSHDVAIWHIVLQPGGKLTLPVAHKGATVNRSLFYVEGASKQMKLNGQEIGEKVVLQVRADEAIDLEYSKGASSAGEFLLLQGVPIQEPVRQHGPFVMNTEAETDQAFRDYQRTQFGGWPWPRGDMVFPREKGPLS